jgi:hypothetical protein
MRTETRTLRCASCPASITLTFSMPVWSENIKRYIDTMGEREGGYVDGKWHCAVHNKAVQP